jgi:4-oxalocrotonate tautomerase
MAATVLLWTAACCASSDTATPRSRDGERGHNRGIQLPGTNMPTIRVELMEGRTPDQKKNLVKALTQAVVDTLGSAPESVDVLLFDIKRSDWATGGELWSEKK